MFGFIKRYFFKGLAFFSTLTRVNSLSCISMNKDECKVRPQMWINLCFFLLVLKQVIAVVVVTISMIYMQNCVFLMFLKILMLEHPIQCQDLVNQDTYNGMKRVNINVDYNQLQNI